MTAMKKIFYLMSICALAFISCQKEELADNRTADGKYTYTFTVSHAVDAKAVVGDKNGTQWPVLWSEGDQLGIYGGDTFYGTAVLKSGAGENTGVFTLNTSEELEVGGEYFVSYPYVEGAAVKTGKVAAEHTLTASGIGANAFAYAYMDYEGNNTAFTLTHTNAYLKFNVSSETFAGYNLTGVTLWATGAELSGAVEVGNGDAVTTTGDGDYVKTILSEPVTVSATPQSVWLSALPADLTGKTVYAIVHMTKGIETVTLPVKLNGAKALQAGAVTEITLPALTKSLAPSWYEPVETRYIAAYGKGWSYGPENTVLFTASGQEKTVELKARGNFMKVKKPATVKVKNVHNDQGMISDRLFINDLDGNTATSFDLDADYSVKVKMNAHSSYGYFSNLLVQDEDGKTIWGTNLWLSTDGVKTAAYNDGQVLDRNIGSSKVASVAKHYTTQGAYFQWGRPFGFAWSTSKGGHSYALVDNTITLEKSAENPNVIYCYSNDGSGDGYPWDWYWGDGSNHDRSGDLDDLWGNPQSGNVDLTTSGVKSNYDPCPKGYRVVSPSVINELNSGINVSIASDGTITSTGATELKTETTNLYYLLYKGVSWGFHGIYQNCKSWNKLASGDSKIRISAFWSNANSGNNAHHLYMYIKTNNTIEHNDTGKAFASRNRAAATPIRCMVDTENR